MNYIFQFYFNVFFLIVILNQFLFEVSRYIQIVGRMHGSLHDSDITKIM